MTTNAAFAAHGVSKSFGPVVALSDVSLSVRAGEVVALMGENGAGKSTLLKIISGDYSADAGTLSLDGAPCEFRSSADARRAGVRVVAQEPEILGHVSVAENIHIGAMTRTSWRYRRSDLVRRTREQLKEFGFADVLDPEVLGCDLSPAQRQLVEIMRVLIDRPAVVAFDEPTSSLTEHEVASLFRLIRRLRAEGTAIIYVSHRMAEIFELADRVTVFRDGKLAGVRVIGETSEAEIVQLMVGRDLEQQFRHNHTVADKVVLRARGLENEHVHDISFDVHSGEVVGIAGLMGAGRSELARTLVGDIPMTSGSVELLGVTLRLRSPRDAVRAGIGLAPEERKAQALLMQRSVRDNLSLAIHDDISRLGFIRRGLERRITGDLVARLRVRTPGLDQLISTLSGGNQQKIVLGRWLARRPHLLILDEPTRGVDVGAKAEIYSIIDQLAADGMAIVVISSELPEVIHLADRVIVMQGGRITGQLDREQATEEAVLRLALPTDIGGAAVATSQGAS